MKHLPLFFAVLLTLPAFSQNNSKKMNGGDTGSIDGIIAALYDVISGPALQTRDWDRFRSLFAPEARLNAVGKGQDGKVEMRTMTVESYIQRVDKQFYMKGFFERELSRKTETFGYITHVFSTYESKQEAGGPVIARGLNSIQLAYYEGRYWVVNILWNGETAENPIPVQYLPQLNQQIVNHEDEMIMVGKINRQGLGKVPYSDWFLDGYKNYKVDEASLKSIGKGLNDVQILVFLGTWCSDSQLEAPHFFKILDYLRYDAEQLTMVALSNHPDHYKESPQHEEKGWNIENVPTFIFLRNGKEVGRIVESPAESLEKDMATILR